MTGISLESLSIVANVPLPFASNAFFGAGQSINIDVQNSHFILSGNFVPICIEKSGRRPATPQMVDLISMSMESGKWSIITSFGTPFLLKLNIKADIPVVGGAAEFDPKNRIQVLSIGTANSINLFG